MDKSFIKFQGDNLCFDFFSSVLINVIFVNHKTERPLKKEKKNDKSIDI